MLFIEVSWLAFFIPKLLSDVSTLPNLVQIAVIEVSNNDYKT